MGTLVIRFSRFLLLSLAFFAQQTWAQQSTNPRIPLVIINSTVTLVDQFGVMTAEDRSGRFDLLFSQIMQSPESVGYVFLYCGKKCRYGEIEAHQRGIEIKIGLRRFERNRIVVVNAGFRENFETELWIAKEKNDVPEPKSTLNIRYVEFSPSSKRAFEAYECCDDYSDFWKNLKP